MQRNTPQCGVTKQCVAKECGAKMWRRRKMWRHQTMWRQTMWRQNVASQENVASPSNVAPNNVAPKCGARGKCGVTKQCGAKQCSAKMWRHRKMRRHKTMWRQTMWRHMSSKCVFIMCLQRQVEKCVLFCQHRAYRDSKKPFIRIPINQPGFNGKQEGFLRGEKHLWLKADVQGTERQSWKLQPTRRLTQEDLKNTSAPWEEESKLKKCNMAKFFFSALCLRELII